jgi:phosphoribosylformylglycinamidine synthase subunit PurQ / glutaminase
MATPKALILSGYGLNCEDETKHAFELAGANADIKHINDIISGFVIIDDYQIFIFPGGFSWGDDTGSGKALAAKAKNNIYNKLKEFIQQDKLMGGFCNGFQVMTLAGFVPRLNGYDNVQVALTHNDSARYEDRWVDLETKSDSPWTKGIHKISLPIAHGEGKFYATPATLMRLNEKGLIAFRYAEGEMCKYMNLSKNPNGSIEDIAGITDETGKILGMMPHPERAVYFEQLPNWTYTKEILQRQGKELPKYGPGLKLFQNAVDYFK